MIRKILSGPGAALLASLVISSTAFAADLSMLAGDWRFASVTNPSAVRESYYNSNTMQTRQSVNSSDFAKAGEQLVDVFFAGEFGIAEGDFALTAEGCVSGDISGSVQVTPSGLVRGTLDGLPISLRLNASGDVMITALLDDDIQEFIVAVKRPADAVTADFEGVWNFVDLGSPTDLTKSYYNSMTQMNRQAPSDSFAGANEQFVDTFFRGAFYAESGSATVASDGSFTGFASGTMTTTANGTAALVIGEGPETFYLNASKNLMIRVKREDGDINEQRITVIVKAPPSLSIADLAGPWRFSNMETPNRLVEVYFNHTTGQTRNSIDSSDFAGRTGQTESLVGMFFPGDFGVGGGGVGIGTDGSLAASFSGGSVAVNTGGSITLTSDGENFEFFVNEARDTMFHVHSTGDSHEMVALVRVPLEPMKIALEVVNGTPSLLWLGQGNVRLQRTSTLNGWSDVTSSTGQSAFESSTTTAEFYRLVEIGSD
jgi:hypothetical protein